jgi:hypothetical protein
VWVSAGPGGLGLSARDCVEPSLYALVTSEWADLTEPRVDRTIGWRATESPVPPQPDYFASLLSPSSLQAAVAQAEAEARDFDVVRGRRGSGQRERVRGSAASGCSHVTGGRGTAPPSRHL